MFCPVLTFRVRTPPPPVTGVSHGARDVLVNNYSDLQVALDDVLGRLGTLEVRRSIRPSSVLTGIAAPLAVEGVSHSSGEILVSGFADLQVALDNISVRLVGVESRVSGVSSPVLNQSFARAAVADVSHSSYEIMVSNYSDLQAALNDIFLRLTAVEASFLPADGSCGVERNTCRSGIVNDSAFADTSAYYNWRCDGRYGGRNSDICSDSKYAYRYCGDGICSRGETCGSCSRDCDECSTVTPDTARPPRCGDSVNSCLSGSFRDVRDTNRHHRWYCGTLLCNDVIDPTDSYECGTSVNSCLSGSFRDVMDTPPGYHRWSCGTLPCVKVKCGDGICSSGDNENCNSCSADCGCPSNETCSSGSCVARPPPPPPECGTAVNTCVSGSFRDETDTTPLHKWRCGTTPCVKAKCGDGICSSGDNENCNSCSADCSCTATKVCSSGGTCEPRGVCSNTVDKCTEGTEKTGTDTPTHDVWSCNETPCSKIKTCLSGQVLTSNGCVRQCPAGQTLGSSGVCTLPACSSGKIRLANGTCIKGSQIASRNDTNTTPPDPVLLPACIEGSASVRCTKEHSGCGSPFGCSSGQRATKVSCYSTASPATCYANSYTSCLSNYNCREICTTELCSKACKLEENPGGRCNRGTCECTRPESVDGSDFYPIRICNTLSPSWSRTGPGSCIITNTVCDSGRLTGIKENKPYCSPGVTLTCGKNTSCPSPTDKQRETLTTTCDVPCCLPPSYSCQDGSLYQRTICGSGPGRKVKTDFVKRCTSGCVSGQCLEDRVQTVVPGVCGSSVDSCSNRSNFRAGTDTNTHDIWSCGSTPCSKIKSGITTPDVCGSSVDSCSNRSNFRAGTDTRTHDIWSCGSTPCSKIKPANISSDGTDATTNRTTSTTNRTTRTTNSSCTPSASWVWPSSFGSCVANSGAVCNNGLKRGTKSKTQTCSGVDANCNPVTTGCSGSPQTIDNPCFDNSDCCKTSTSCSNNQIATTTSCDGRVRTTYESCRSGYTCSGGRCERSYEPTEPRWVTTWGSCGNFGSCSNGRRTGTQTATVRCEKGQTRTGTSIDCISTDMPPSTSRNCERSCSCSDRLPQWSGWSWSSCDTSGSSCRNRQKSGTKTATRTCARQGQNTNCDTISCSGKRTDRTSCTEPCSCSYRAPQWGEWRLGSCRGKSGATCRNNGKAGTRTDTRTCASQGRSISCNPISCSGERTRTRSCTAFCLCSYRSPQWGSWSWSSCDTSGSSCRNRQKSGTKTATRTCARQGQNTNCDTISCSGKRTDRTSCTEPCSCSYRAPQWGEWRLGSCRGKSGATCRNNGKAGTRTDTRTCASQGRSISCNPISCSGERTRTRSCTAFCWF